MIPKSDTGRHIGLDQTWDNVNRWPLSRQDHVDPRCTRLLSKANNSIFHFFTCHHHQVCQLVDNDHDQRKGHLLHLRLGIVLSHLGIKASNISSAYFWEELVAIFHLINDLLQSSTGLAWIGYHWNQEMRNIIVDRKLHHLRIDHHKFDFVWTSLHQDTRNNPIDRYWLTRSGRPRYQEMGHPSQIKGPSWAINSLPKRNLKEFGRISFGLLPQFTEGNGRNLWVGHFNPDQRLPWNRRFNPHILGC